MSFLSREACKFSSDNREKSQVSESLRALPHQRPATSHAFPCCHGTTTEHRSLPACLPACQSLGRYDVSSVLTLCRGFLGSPSRYFLLVYCDLLLFPGDSRLDQRGLDIIYENKGPGDHPSNGLPACRSEIHGGRVSESPFTRSRESAWRFHQGHRKATD